MPSGTRVAFIHNRRAPRSVVDEACRAVTASGASVEVRTTGDRQEGDRAAREAARAGATVIVAAGGDGTVQSVLGACLDHGAALGVLPLGTANDLAARLGLPDVASAARAIAAGDVRQVDAGACTYVDEQGAARDDAFVTTAGVGVLAEVARQERAGAALRMKQTLGNAAWPLLFAKAFLSSRGADAELTVDGARARRSLALLEVCKVPKPGGFTLAPGADLDTGVLHAWCFGGLPLGVLLAHVARAVITPGGHLRTGVVDVLTGARVRVEPATPMPVQVNGDYVGVTPATFEIRPRALRLVVARGSW